ncbi:cryptochrome-1-like isoform X1 [Lingula anatina]|uniref:Cryptochrome-1-like isoform X1 n=2 Tax=Lingula anatina TaxID=7574 RepID=A0A1S3HDP4_LINAN|nr:cryptochrome-1-like isoform X1 [Lingula anatina]|eukprot:XP_013384158.1 cryptochrome-1-like isoform X1 [Lingula anatina]
MPNYRRKEDVNKAAVSHLQTLSWSRDEYNMSSSRTHKTLHWFRKGLRLHDNPALLAACTKDCAEFRPIFILDPWFVKNARVGVNRWRFLLQALKDLDDSLKKLKSRLFVLKGKPHEVFPKIFKEWGITRLTFEVDTEPYARVRDAEIIKLAKEHNVEVIQKISHTLYDTEKVIARNGGSAPLTYQRFQTVLSQLGAPPRTAETLTSEHLKGCITPVTADHDQDYGVPTLKDLKVDTADMGEVVFPGGETEALKRMERYLKKSNWICNFEKPKTEPNSLEPSTTVLSPYLKFGCLSARLFWHRLQEIYKQCKKHSQPPVSLHGQLLWREFFYTAGLGVANFDRMEGNPVCRQIPWENKPEYIEAWTHARTGYPFIDAIMTQLRQEGWIHHLARHAVACFLTRGDLWVSWEEGQKVFEELLLDADWSLNAGNWQWLSASAFFHQYFRVYSPIAFGKKTDPQGEYIKKYLPMLKKFPKEYIYEPWKAPRAMQEKAGCIIGKDYPRPIVDHGEISKVNIKKMAAAYALNKDQNATEKGTPKKRKSEADANEKSKSKKPKKGSSEKITNFLEK